MSTLTKTAFEAAYTDNTTGTFADNTTQAISAGDMRQFADDISDSFTFSGGLNFKVIQIGDWNMDTTTTVSIDHGLSDYKKVRSISCIIRDDLDVDYSPLERQTTSGAGDLAGAIVGIIGTVTKVSLTRTTGGYYDGNTDYNATSYNRGWVTIGYVD